MTLPQPIQQAVQPLFAALPIEDAMSQLVVDHGASAELIAMVERICYEEPIASHPKLAAGLWLYLDELDRSHTISQSISDATGSFWHGIMHRREGDFGNSHYWFRKVGAHPAFDSIDTAASGGGYSGGGYDGHAFIDEVAAADMDNPPDALIEKQRAEWQGLFKWCGKQT